jgi:hypothetical protein
MTLFGWLWLVTDAGLVRKKYYWLISAEQSDNE